MKEMVRAQELFLIYLQVKIDSSGEKTTKQIGNGSKAVKVKTTVDSYVSVLLKNLPQAKKTIIIN